MKPKSLTAVVKSYKRWKANSTGQQRAPSRIKKSANAIVGSITNAGDSKPTSKQEAEVRKGIQKIRFQSQAEGRVRETMKE